jgi:hypothetical protein
MLHIRTNLLLGVGKSSSSPTFFPFQLIFPVQISAQLNAAVSPTQAGKRLRSKRLWKTEARPPLLARKLHYGASPAMVFPQKSGRRAKKCVVRRFFSEEIIFFQAAILFRPVCVRVPLFRSVCSRNLL